LADFLLEIRIKSGNNDVYKRMPEVWQIFSVSGKSLAAKQI
jgi:hypothetical protein